MPEYTPDTTSKTATLPAARRTHGPKSIRARTTLVSTVVVGIVLLAFSSALVWATQAILTNTVRDTLATNVDAVEALVVRGELPSTLTGMGNEQLIQVIDSTGSVLSASSWASDVPALDPGDVLTGQSEVTEETQVCPGKGNGYGYGQGAGTGAGQGQGSGQSTGQGAGSGAGQGAGSDGGNGTGQGTGQGTGNGAGQRRQYQKLSSETIASHSAGLLAGLLGGLFEAGVAHATTADSPTNATVGAEESNSDTALNSTSSPDATSDETFLTDSEIFGNEGPYLVYRRGVEGAYGPVTIVAVSSLNHALETAKTVGLVLACVMPLALLIVSFAVWRITGHTLEPVESLRRQAGGVALSSLDQRITVKSDDPQITELTASFNDMLARLEESLAEQQRFVSDASHELKSPVAAMRIMIETAQEYPNSIDATTLLEDLHAENDRLAQIVSDLLFLARKDENGPKPEMHSLDLQDLIAHEVMDLSNRSNIVCDTSGVQPIVYTGDAQGLSRLLRNLFDNAARYAQTSIWVSSQQEEDGVRLLVSDDGPGISPQDRERVFERFTRLEEGRDRNSGGTGLGLPVVRAIAEQHNGSARFIEPLHGGATIEVVLR